MKKHSEWQKLRHQQRLLHKAINKLNGLDGRRASQWNAAIKKAQGEHDGDMFWMYVEKPLGNADFRDMFIEQLPVMATPTQKSGLYSVVGVSHASRYDYLLECRLMGDDNARVEFIWFPRLGQRVVTAKEAGEYPL